MNREKQEKLYELIGELCNGTISEADHRALEQMLAGDEQARQAYVHYMDTHAALKGWAAGRRRTEPLRRLWPARSVARAAKPQRRAWYRRPMFRYAMVAAVTLCASLAIQVPFNDNDQAPVGQRTASAAVVTAPDYVATLLSAVNCEWSADSPRRFEGQRLLPGVIKLTKGVAEIRFDSGANLILTAPAELRIESVGSAALLLGNAAVAAPEEAIGFTLQTPAPTVVDMGTEFAVAVEPTGATEIHVFNGEVEWHTPGVASEAHELPAGQALRFDPGVREARAVPIAADRFVRSLDAMQGGAPAAADAALLAYEGFDYAGTQLGRGNGGFGWLEGWRRDRGKRPLPAVAQVVEPGLFGPLGSGSSTGAKMEVPPKTASMRELASPLRLNADGVYYISFLLNRHYDPLEPRHGTTLLMFRSSDSNTAKLGFGVTSRNNVMVLHSGRNSVAGRIVLESDTTYLIVGKLVVGADAPDQMMLKIYAPSQSIDRQEPMAWSVVGHSVYGDAVLDQLVIQSGGSATCAIDEIRIGSTWQSVAGGGSVAGSPSNVWPVFTFAR